MDKRPVISDTYERQPFKLVTCGPEPRVIGWTRAPCDAAMREALKALAETHGVPGVAYQYVRDKRTGK